MFDKFGVFTKLIFMCIKTKYLIIELLNTIQIKPIFSNDKIIMM